MWRLLSQSLFVATRQLRHRSKSSMVMLAGVCMAVLLMFMQLGFRNALYDSAIKIPQSVVADIIITNHLYESLTVVPPWLPRSLLAQVKSVEGVADARPLYVMIMDVNSAAKGTKMSTWLLAFDLGQPVFQADDINRQIDVLKLPNAAILDSLSRYEYQPIVREAIAGNTPTLTLPQGSATLSPYVDIVGLFTKGPTFFADGLMISSDLNYFRWTRVPLDRVSLGLVTLGPGTDPVEAKSRIQAFVGNGYRVLSHAEFLAQERNFYATRTPIGTIFNLGLVVGMVVGVVFISQVLHGIIDANIREYAVLNTMGYEVYFFGLIVLEISLIVSLLTFIPSLGLSALLYKVAADATTLPLRLTLDSVKTVFYAVLSMGVFASLLAMRKLRNANPLDLFG